MLYVIVSLNYFRTNDSTLELWSTRLNYTSSFYYNLVILWIMPSSRCVVQDCDNRRDSVAGISLHYLSVDAPERPKWIRFVRLHSSNFKPTGKFPVCSDHFAPQCFERAIHIPGQVRQIQPGSIPSIWKRSATTSPVSSRKRRKVSTRQIFLVKFHTDHLYFNTVWNRFERQLSVSVSKH